MNFVAENWFIIVAAAAGAGVAGYAVFVFAKMPSTEQLTKVKEWLLFAVTKAERELGSGTGKIKLRYVYDMFVSRFTWLAKIISFEAFSLLVDEALGEMRAILETNTAVQSLVKGTEKEENI